MEAEHDRSVWGEPEDRMIRARELAQSVLISENREAADLVSHAGIARIGVNEDVFMVLVHVCPDRQSDETSLDVPLTELASLSEQAVANRIIEWAHTLVKLGHAAGDITQ